MPSVLDGIRVLDFSRIFAGPAATQILGDLGADIIKIEEPGHGHGDGGGDDARTFGVTAEAMRDFGASPSFLALNRNKRSMVLDLRQPTAREVAVAMAGRCDVLVHNFRPRLVRLADQDRPEIRFCFEGEDCTARAGDTLLRAPARIAGWW